MLYLFIMIYTFSGTPIQCRDFVNYRVLIEVN
jgi:hypothetical protein